MMAKANDTEIKKVVISRRVDNITIEAPGGSKNNKDFVEQAGYVVINGKPTMKNYTVLLEVEVDLPETIIDYIKNRAIEKKSSGRVKFIKQFDVEYL